MLIRCGCHGVPAESETSPGFYRPPPRRVAFALSIMRSYAEFSSDTLTIVVKTSFTKARLSKLMKMAINYDIN